MMEMNNLPIEILNNIFIYVDLLDRIQCTLVCHHWYYVLQEYSLFSRVDIKSVVLFKRFLQVMEQSPHYAAQVQELCVDGLTHQPINKRTYVNIFPNARVFEVEWHIERNHIQSLRPYREQIELSRPASKVKILHDSAYCELASQMLVSNLCGGLKELKLNFVHPFIVDSLNVIGQLKNLPTLSRLALESCWIRVCDLEMIHKNAPNIQELKLNFIYIVNGETPSIISPAHSVTSIHININGAFLTPNLGASRLHRSLYQYMSRKYPNLVNVEHHNQQLLNSLPAQRRQIFLYGLHDFYRSIIHPSTTKLNIQAVPSDINIFDECDDKDCKISELRAHRCDKEGFLQHLIDSNQRNNILKLHLDDTEIDSPSDLIYLKELQVLMLSYPWPFGSLSIRLKDYLNGCPPSLKYFSINCTDLTAEPSSTCLSTIKALAICCRDPNQALCKVISSSFPHLVELSLTGTICIQNSITLELLSPTLKRATFTYTRTPSRGIGFVYKSLKETEFQIYHKCRNKFPIKLVIDSVATFHALYGANAVTITTLEKKSVKVSSNGITLFSI